MDEMILKRLNEALDTLLPRNDKEIHSTADLKENSNPAIRDLCEAAELVIRLSKEERV